MPSVEPPTAPTPPELQTTARRPGAGSDRRGAALAVAAVALLGLLAYSNALRGAFVFDDVRQVRDNPLIRDLSSFLPGRYTGSPNRWAGYLSFALNYRAGGLVPFGYHLVNVAVHVANALLVYALVRLTFRTPRLRRSALAPSSYAIAFAAAAVFVAHPLQTQAVTYVVQRFTSLATAFYLATVVLYARWRLRERPGLPVWRRIAGGAAVVVTAVLAMRTKEIAFTLPFVVALYELSFLDGTSRARLLRLAPVLATLPLIPLATLAIRSAPGVALAARVAESTRVDTPVSRLDYLRTQLVVIAEYLRLLFIPTGQNLDHDVPIYRSVLDPRVAASLAVLVALAVVAAVLYRRTAPDRGPVALDPAARVVGFGIGWFFLALLVESSVIPISDFMYEHRAYLPSVGIVVAAATAFAALARRLPRVHPGRATALAGGVAALVLAGATLARNVVWQNDLTLWSDAARKSPRKPRPALNLGTALAVAGRPDLAVPALRQAVALDPTSAYARAQLGVALLASRHGDEGEAELREALRLAPSDPEVLFNLATHLWVTGRREEARPLFARFVDVAPPAYAQARRVAAARAAEVR
jgi:tetratricopeptide (TPR) repeat protein